MNQSILTSEIENIIKQAQQIGLKNKVKYVGTEQIIYGILVTPNNYAQMVLKNAGLDKSVFIEKLKFTFDPYDATQGYTPNTKAVIQLAIKISKDSNVNFVSAEHILLAILMTKECKACQIFRNLGLDFSSMINALETRILKMGSTNKKDDV